MQVVYSLDIETQEVKLHKTTDYSQALDETALEFLAYEEGQRHAKILEDEINFDEQEPGYFLHRENHRIAVYKKIQHLHHGWVGSSVQYEIKHVMNFALADFPLSTKPQIFTHDQKAPSRATLMPQRNPDMDAVIAEFKEKIRKKLENEPIVIENEAEWKTEDEDRMNEVNEDRMNEVNEDRVSEDRMNEVNEDRTEEKSKLD